jgi:hypothetical protein
LIETGSYAYDTIPALDFDPVDPRPNVKGTFAWWTPEVVKVENNKTYTATYTAPVGPAKYTVNWYNSNGELINQTSVNYWDKASYTGDEPTSWKNAQYNYVFKGWTLSWSEDIVTEFPNIESDTAFVAKYDAILNSYDIVFEYTWANGSLIIESGNYLYGTETGKLAIPTVTGYSDNYNTYEFD